MLLKKYDENKEALQQIGREAIIEAYRLGLPISEGNLKNIAKDAGMSMRIEELANGAFVSEELLKVKYVGNEPDIKQVRLTCQHIHGTNDSTGITNMNQRAYELYLGKTKILETDNFAHAMKEFDAI